MDQILLSDYDYELPEVRIAEFPISPRDASRLLVYRQGEISHHIFRDLPNILPKGSFLFFNNTRVIPARIYLRRESGALIEIFLLNPHTPSEMSKMMQAQSTCTWKCLIGNKKKWKTGEILKQNVLIQNQEVHIEVSLVDAQEQYVQFTWQPEGLLWADLLPEMGQIPLPPYIQRALKPEDSQNYQTVYALESGAVAAPTAGLHFTSDLLDELKNKGVQQDFLTLHVSAGTFQPVKSEQVVEHPMHKEQIGFNLENIQNLLANLDNIIPVGTTSMRALESLYWYGVKLYQEDFGNQKIPFNIEKLYPYGHSSVIAPEDALKAVLAYMQHNQMTQLWGQSEIFILPGYEFKLCRGLITNFHLPKSTLLLLISAFVGEKWKKIYQTAIDQGYRFLSYGDSSLLIP
ncbi:MAG: S-adenosylmethionine:tRNA ribosyltransferase-isomerase [Microscillaceae bacterium]|nr:S-adenosylmethionine:tRNA ribosyltransferase-isomerase [Microscillaceae bacterium]